MIIILSKWRQQSHCYLMGSAECSSQKQSQRAGQSVGVKTEGMKPIVLYPGSFSQRKEPGNIGASEPLHRDSCDLQQPCPIFENNRMIFVRAQQFQKKKEKTSTKHQKTSSKITYTRLIMQSQHEVCKAYKSTYINFQLQQLSLPSFSLIIPLVKACITLSLVQCSKQLAVPLVQLNFQFKLLSSATTCKWAN